MKKYILISLIVFMIVPFLLSLVDLYWWFWFEHNLTNINWTTDSGTRICIALCFAIASGFPTLLLNEEKRRERVM